LIIDNYKVLELFQKEKIEFINELRNKYILKYNIDEENVLKLIDKRNEYKQNKDYENADKVRDELLSIGVVIKDSSLGTEWDIMIKK